MIMFDEIGDAMIELTSEQARALGQGLPHPPRFVHPQTGETFVLLSLADYKRLHPAEDDWTDSEHDQLRAEACKLLDSW